MIQIISQIDSLNEINFFFLFYDKICENETLQSSVEVQITVTEIFIRTNDISRERIILQVINLVSLVVDFYSKSEVSICSGIVGIDKQIALILQTVENRLAASISGIPSTELVFLIMVAQFLVLLFQHFINILLNSR